MANNKQITVKGVHWHPRDKRWHARARIDGRPRHLGSFERKEDAEAAVLRAVPAERILKWQERDQVVEVAHRSSVPAGSERRGKELRAELKRLKARLSMVEDERDALRRDCADAALEIMRLKRGLPPRHKDQETTLLHTLLKRVVEQLEEGKA